MKALVYTGTQMSEIRDVDMPVEGDNQVLVDLAFCGICGSDMHAWHGHDERRVPPLVLGHEAVGIVQTGALAGKRSAICASSVAVAGSLAAGATGITSADSSNAFIVKTDHSGNPTALQIGGAGAINGVSSANQSFTILNVACTSVSLSEPNKDLYFTG